jgi:hypothetical protein
MRPSSKGSARLGELDSAERVTAGWEKGWKLSAQD